MPDSMAASRRFSSCRFILHAPPELVVTGAFELTGGYRRVAGVDRVGASLCCHSWADRRAKIGTLAWSGCGSAAADASGLLQEGGDPRGSVVSIDPGANASTAITGSDARHER